MRRFASLPITVLLIPLAVVLLALGSLQAAAQRTDYRIYLPGVGRAMPRQTTSQAVPSIVVRPSSLDFGVADINTTITRTLTVGNVGTTDLTVFRIAFAPLTSAAFRAQPAVTLPVSLTAGSFISVTVTFTPADAGAHRGALNVTSDDPQQPTVAVSLRGFGGQGPPVDKPQERFEHYREIRSSPGISVTGAFRQRAWDQLQTLRPGFVPPVPVPGRESKTTVDQTFRWRSIGPRNVGTTGAGRITTIAIDQTGVIYAGAALGGVYKSSDGGTTWRSLMTHQPSLAMGSIGIDPNDRQRIYVGTGEQNFALDSYYGAGVLRATDGGELGDASWFQFGRTPFVFAAGGGATFAKIMVDPRNSTTVLAATSLGFYRSTNSGEDWTQITAGIPAATVTDLVMDPTTNPVTLYAAVPGSGIYRSTDAGLNWGLRVNGLPAVGNFGRIALAIAPSNTQILYAGIEDESDNNNNLLGVFRTADGGANWASIGAPDYCSGQCWYDNVLGVDPTNPNRVFLGGIGAVFAVGAGNPLVWAFPAVSGLHADQHAIAWDPNDSTIVYVGNDGGVYRSTNSGANFTRLDIGAITQHQGFMNHPVLTDWAVAGSQDNGSMFYTGDTVNWTAAAGCDGGNSAVSQSLAAPNEVYITTQSTGCSRIARADTIAGGFNQKTTGITIGANGRPDGNALFYPPLEIDPNNSSTLYYASNFVYRTTDRGDNWSYFPSPAQSLNGRVSTIGVAPSDSTTIYAGTDSGRVWRMTTASTNWVEVNDFAAPCPAMATCLPQRFVTRVLASPTTATTLYVTFGGFAGGGRPGHVFRSTDSGATWTDITPRDFFNNRIDLPVNAMAIDPNAPNRLFIGTDIGVLYSDNDGGAWQFLDVGLPDVAIFNMHIHPSTGVLRVATHGRSTYELEVAGPRLTVEKRVVSPSSGIGTVGGTVTYSIWVTNTGTVNITSLPLDDIFDGRYLRYQSASPTPSAVAPNLVEWDDLTGLPPNGTGRSLRPNEGIEVRVTFQIIACPDVVGLSNKVRVSGAIDEDRNPVPTTSSAATLNLPCATAELTKTRLGPERVAQDEIVEFEVRIRNTGNVTINPLPLQDTFDPTALTFVSAVPAPDVVAAGSLTWNNLGPLAPGASRTVRLTFRASGCPVGQTTTNTARVQGASGVGPSGPIAIPTLTATATVDIACPDIRIEKTLVSPVSGVIPLDGIATFNIRITNQGNKTIRRLPLEDLFDPTHLQFESASPAPNAVGYGHVQWTDLTAAAPNGFDADLAPGGSVNITLRLRGVGCPPKQDTVDKARVVGAIDEENNPVPTVEDTASVKVACPEVTLSKVVANPDPCGVFGPGDPVLFTVTITNTGNTTLVTIPLVDTFDPTYLQFVSATPTPNSVVPAGTLTWTDLTGPPPNGFGMDLPPGQVFTVNLTFTALASTSALPDGVTINRVRIQGAVDEFGFIAPTATAQVGVAIRDADLYVEKTQITQYPRVQVRDGVADTLGMSPFEARRSNTVVTAGEIITYNIKYGNNGPDEAAFVRIIDTIPAGTVYLGHNLAPCIDHDIRVGCFVGRVAPGEKREFQVWVRVPLPSEPGFSTPPGTLLVNRVEIESGFTETGPVCGTPDGTPANNNVTYTTTVLGDFGDAPSAPIGSDLPGYGAQSTAAYSANYTREWLGRAVSGERSATDGADPDAEPNLNPFNTDHHDDGVFYRNPFAVHLPTSQRIYFPGERAVTARVTVSVATPDPARYNWAPDRRLYITAWADSNKNGVFGDVGDMILFEWNGGPGIIGTDLGLWPADQPYRVMDLRIRVPGEIGYMMVRTRLNYGAPPNPGGVQDYGEIEDYLIGVFPDALFPPIPGPAQPRPPAP